MRSFKTSLISIAGILGIETFEWFDKVPIILKFSTQLAIGILTIVFLIKKIQIMNDLRKNKDNEKNITIS
jgi:hypothetical protein